MNKVLILTQDNSKVVVFSDHITTMIDDDGKTRLWVSGDETPLRVDESLTDVLRMMGYQ